jgi:hypothetical protein
MEQKIFEIGLSTEGTSLYLMLVALSDQGTPLLKENMAPMWNTDQAKLDDALAELRERGVLGKASEAYHIRPPSEWDR